jgi:flotillin
VREQVRVSAREVHVLDPGDGSALASYAASYPLAVAAVLRAIGMTTGVDVPAILGQPPDGDTRDHGGSR